MTIRAQTTLAAPIAALLAAAAPARADEAADIATARALGIEGVTLANAGRCHEAIDPLERAERLHHAPTTATRLGECEIEIGRLVSGTERLQRVVREPLAPNAHPAFAAAVARARRDLDQALPRLAALRIVVNAPDGVEVTLTIDGERAPSAILGTDRPTDPGSHTVTVAAPGFVRAGTVVSLGEGERKSVDLDLERDPNAPVADRGADAAAAAGPDERGSGSGSSKLPGVIALGVGAAALGVGIYAGARVARTAGDLSDGCDANRVCPSDRDADIRDARRWATVSTVGFATAGVAVAGGVILLLLSGGSEPKATGRRVRPSIGLGSVSVEGTF